MAHNVDWPASLDSTRVINNAQGYPKEPTEPNNAFRKDLVIQVD